MCPALRIRMKGLECSCNTWGSCCLASDPSRRVLGGSPASKHPDFMGRCPVARKQGGTCLGGKEATTSPLCSETRRGLLLPNDELKTGLLLSLPSFRKQPCRHPTPFHVHAQPWVWVCTKHIQDCFGRRKQRIAKGLYPLGFDSSILTIMWELNNFHVLH